MPDNNTILTFSLLNENQSILLDKIADGQWHAHNKISKSVNKTSLSSSEISLLLSHLTKNNVIIAGNNNSFRFVSEHLETWRIMRNITSRKAKDLTAPRYFGGILEDDGWLLAPLKTHDLVHFRTDGSVSKAEIQQKIQFHGVVNQNPDGLVRISTLEGEKIYHQLKKWAKEEKLAITGVRLDKNVRRRELMDLPKMFIDDLCAFYGSFSHTLLRKSKTSIQRHLTEADDVQQQIYLWIIDAIQRYDATTSIPFAAYLHSCLTKWVHDLNRKSYGRSAADNELKYSRVTASLTNELGRKPTLPEIAVHLNESEKTVQKEMQSIRHINNMRTASTINDENHDIQLSHYETPEKDYHSMVEQTILSSALTTAALQPDGDKEPQILAWLKVYTDAWAGGTKNTTILKTNTADLLLAMKTKVKDAIN